MKNLLLKTKRRLFLAFMLGFTLIGVNVQSQTITENFEEAEWTAVATSNTGNATGGTIVISSYNGGTNGTALTGSWRYSSAWLITNNTASSKSYTVHGGTYAFHYASSGSAYIMTPLLPNGITSISYWARTASTSATTGIFIGTNTTFTSSAAMMAATNTTGGGWYASTFSTVNSTLGWSQVSFNITGNASTAPCYIKICRTSSEATIDDIVITTPITGPTVSLTSGEKDATVMSTEQLTPVVYTWVNSTENATFAWDAATPENIQAVTDADAKTITISGTAGNVTENTTYNYTVSIPEGNTINGSITLTPYSTPAPVFSSPSNKSQTVKAGTAIADIVFTIQNAEGATLDGLPNTFTGVYNNGTFTISGTPDAETTYPAMYNYTVTATSLAGYTGEAVTATGTITVKDPNSRAVAYVINTAVSGNDTQILPALQALYDVTTVKVADITTSYDFSPYDLVVLTESPSSGSTGMKALWGIDKPLLNMKAYAVQANTWNFGTPAENTGVRQNIRVAQPTHPIFTGVTLDNDTLVLLSGVGSSDKGLQTTTFGTNNVNNPGIALAYLTTSTTAISILEIKAGVDANGAGVSVTGVKNEVLQNKFMQIGIADVSINNLTTDGLKIIANAAAYLISPEVFKNPNTKILSMTIGGSAATIDENAKTATVDLLQGTNLSALNVSLTLSAGAALTAPASLTGLDFTNPVTFTVQAEDETVPLVNYTVTVTANKPTSITNVGTAAKVSVIGSTIVVKDAAGAKVKVVSLGGVALYQGVLSSTEEELPLVLNTGVYAVLVDGVATKILVK